MTNTQYHKIILAWQGIGTKPKPEIADLLWKSLDIKEVNKEFYKQIKERFDSLLGIVRTQHSVATENEVKTVYRTNDWPLYFLLVFKRKILFRFR